MLKNFFVWLFNSIYKQNCCVCGCAQAENFLCKTCAKSINFLSGFAHTKIGGVEIYSVCLYDDILKKLVMNYKFKNKVNIKYVFAGFLKEFYGKNLSCGGFVVVPVPSHKNRVSRRGYDHIRAFCDVFCGDLEIPKNYELLKRVKDTKPHFKLSAKQRQKNVEGCFVVDKSKYDGENLLIVDDLITTGATLGEVIKEFKSCGIDNITCLTVCKV